VEDPYPLIAYPPLQRDIKPETPDDNEEVNTVDEDDWTLQVQNYIIVTKSVNINSVLYSILALRRLISHSY